MRIKRILASVLAAAIAVSATAVSVFAADPDGSANYVFSDGKTGTSIEIATVYAPLEGIKTATVEYKFTDAEKKAFDLYNLLTLGFAFIGSTSGVNPEDITAYYMTTGNDVKIDTGWKNANTWSAIVSKAFDGKVDSRDITGVKFVIEGKSAVLVTNKAKADSLVTLRDTLVAAQSMIDNTKAAGAVSAAAVSVALTKVAAVADGLDAVLGLVSLDTDEATINAFYDKLVLLSAGRPADYVAIADLDGDTTVADAAAYLPAGYKFAMVTAADEELAAAVVGTTKLSALVDTGVGGPALLDADGDVVASADAIIALNAEVAKVNLAEGKKITDAQAAFDAVSFTKADAEDVKAAINKVLGEKAVKETLFNDIYKELAGNNVKGTFYMFGQLAPKAYVLTTPDFNKTTNITWGGWANTGVAGWLDKGSSITFEQILIPEEASNDFWVKNVVNKDGVLEWRGALWNMGLENINWWYNSWPEAITAKFFLVNELGGKLEIYDSAAASGANQGKTAGEIAKFLGNGNAKSLELVLINTDKNNDYNFSISVGEITYSAYPKGYKVPAAVTTTEKPTETEKPVETEKPADTTADDLDEAPNTGAAALVIAPVVISAIATVISKKRK